MMAAVSVVATAVFAAAVLLLILLASLAWIYPGGRRYFSYALLLIVVTGIFYWGFTGGVGDSGEVACGPLCEATLAVVNSLATSSIPPVEAEGVSDILPQLVNLTSSLLFVTPEYYLETVTSYTQQ